MMLRSCARLNRDRRAFALPAVLIVGVGAIMLAVSIIWTVRAETAAATHIGERAQSEALAHSALQILAHELDQQREAILNGERPRLEQQYTVYESAGRVGVVRLLSMNAGNESLIPDAGRIDLNTVDAESLTVVESIDQTLAEAIIAQRSALFQSQFDLLRIDRVNVEQLYGPLDELIEQLQTSGRDEQDDLRSPLMRTSNQPLADATMVNLAELFTVHTAEPDIQRNGRLRINVNVEWSDELGRRLDERFGDGAGEMLKRIFDDGNTIDNPARIVELLLFFNTPTEDWADILDALTTTDAGYQFGRVDINTAPMEALLTLPGVDIDQANAIVQRRRDLAAEDRADITWPLREQILERESYRELIGRITTRCWSWRLRFAAGEVDAEDPEGPLQQPVVYEVVFDLADPAARVAYLRDITLLATSAALSPISDASNVGDEDATADAVDDAAESDASTNASGTSVNDDDSADADDALGDLFNDDEAGQPTDNAAAAGDEGSFSAGGETDTESADATVAADTPVRIGRWLIIE